MDLATYASELIKQRGKLFVPGLGYFAYVRRNSYYDPESESIYPPFYQISFDSHRVRNDDSELTSYITRRKNISLSSSKYFLEKFIEKLKLQAETEDVQFGDLGYFCIDQQSRLSFVPKETDLHQNTSLFGYAPVRIQKLQDLGNSVPSKPVSAPQPIVDDAFAPVASNEVNTNNTSIDNELDSALMPPASDRKSYIKPFEEGEKPFQIDPDNDGPILVTNVKNKPPVSEPVAPLVSNTDAGEDEELEGSGLKSNLTFWVTLCIVIIAATAGLLAYYRSHTTNSGKQDMANHINNNLPPTTVKLDTQKTAAETTSNTPSTIAPSPATDTTAPGKPATQQVTTSQATAPAKSSANAPAGANETLGEVPKNTWLITGGQFANLNNAKREVAIYHTLGYSKARLLDSIPRKQYFSYKVIFGYRYTKKDALKAKAELLKERKIKPSFLDVQPYK